MDFKLSYEYNKEKNIWEVEIKGEVDIYNSSLLKEKLTSLLDINKSDVYIDCSGLEYIDSTGLGAMVGLLKRVKHYDGEVKLLNVKNNVYKIFHITDLDKVFTIEGGSDD